jgi:hypothetical protein
MGVEGVNGIADGLVVAAEGGRNLPGVLPPRTGKQDLAAAPVRLTSEWPGASRRAEYSCAPLTADMRS